MPDRRRESQARRGDSSIGGSQDPPLAPRSTPRLGGPYYAECQRVFRRATDQGEHMLAELQRLTDGRQRLSILSVGSGTGLFEVPMLERMRASGVRIDSFVGIDVDRRACRTLEQRLRRCFADRIEFQVLHRRFEDYRSDRRFDLVLFVHTFEYLPGAPLRWIERARRLTAPNGWLAIFSPQRGGINAIYEQVTHGSFSDDLERLLLAGEIPYRARQIEAECDIVPLADPAHAERHALLSFLTQLDCRGLDPARLEELAAYYQSLAPPGTSKLPHPTTLFVIAG